MRRFALLGVGLACLGAVTVGSIALARSGTPRPNTSTARQSSLPSASMRAFIERRARLLDTPAARARALRHERQVLAAISRVHTARGLTAHLAALRRGSHLASGAAALPADVAAGLAQNGYVTVNPSAAVLGGSSNDIWLVPGSTGACILTPGRNGATTCNVTAKVLDGGLLGGSGPASSTPGAQMLPTSITGVAPDGNPTVSITLANGTVEQAPVVNNIYTVDAGSIGIKSVQLTTSGGLARTISLG